MKKSKTKGNKGRSRKESRAAAKPREASKAQSAVDTALVPTDIRKAYKNRLINAYFSRPH